MNEALHFLPPFPELAKPAFGFGLAAPAPVGGVVFDEGASFGCTAGVPSKTTHTEPPIDGYRIHKHEYYLDDPGLEPDELAALHLATNLVRLDEEFVPLTGAVGSEVKLTFTGKIHCTHATADLCRLMLADAAHIQEEEARYANRKGYSKHKPALPLFRMADARAALKLLESTGHTGKYDHSRLFLGNRQVLQIEQPGGVGEVLKARDVDVHWLGARRGLEAELVAERSRIQKQLVGQN